MRIEQVEVHIKLDNQELDITPMQGYEEAKTARPAKCLHEIPRVLVLNGLWATAQKEIGTLSISAHTLQTNGNTVAQVVY